MLAETTRGVVQSSEGYEVAFLGIKFVTYREGDHVIRFGKDTNSFVIRYYLKEIPCWDPPFSSEPIAAEKRSQIQRRVLDALDFRGRAYWTDITGEVPAAGAC